MPKPSLNRRSGAAKAAVNKEGKSIIPMMIKNEHGYELLNPKIVSYLENNFEGRRWTKGSFDRLYPVAEDLGFEIDTYKTGNISSSYVKKYTNLKGVDMDLVNKYEGVIANSRTSRMTGDIRDTWINLKTGKIESRATGRDADFIRERLKYKVLEAQLNAE